MSESFLIILIELVLVLTAGGGYLLFKAHGKKRAMGVQLKALLRKADNEALNRKEKLTNSFKALGVADSQAELSAEQLVNAEVSCVRKFAVAQLNKAADDVAFFSDAVYDLSAMHMDVSMLNAESMASMPIPIAPVVEPEQHIESEIDEEHEAAQFDDDIEVSLDLDKLEESSDPENLAVESDGTVEPVEVASKGVDEADEEGVEEASVDEPKNVPD